jgi:CAAX protease family protein
LSAARQLAPLPAVGLWAVLSLAADLYGNWNGLGGRSYAATLTAFCVLLLAMLLCAARGVTDKLTARLGHAASILFGVALLLAYLIYALGTNTFAIGRVAVVLALIFIPLAIAASAERQPPGAWQDFAIVVAVWVAVKFAPAHWLWPYPGGRLSYVFTVLLMVNVGIVVYLFARQLNGVGYGIGWGQNWAAYIAASFLLFAVIAVPLGLAMHFLQFAPQWRSAAMLPLTALGILLFTAWPEEFLFRGLLQNMLTRTTGSNFAALCVASVLFGFAHVTNGHFPNWRYVLLATLAGFFYGWTWRKTESIFASAMVHALVDALWHFLFRTI